MTFSFGREVVEAASVKYRLDMLRPITRIWTIMTPVLRMLTSSISMLYGWACQQPLAIGGFRRLSEEEKNACSRLLKLRFFDRSESELSVLLTR